MQQEQPVTPLFGEPGIHANVRQETVWPPAPTSTPPRPPLIPSVEATRIFRYLFSRFIGYGAGFGAIYGGALGLCIFVIGVVFGAPIGAILGLVLGFVDGIVIGLRAASLVRRGVSMPLIGRGIRAWAPIVTGLGGIVAALINTPPFGNSYSPNFLDKYWFDLIVWVIAMVASWHAACRITKAMQKEFAI